VSIIGEPSVEQGTLQDAFPDDDTVWGVAYTIDPAYVAEVREYLGGHGWRGTLSVSDLLDHTRLPREGWYMTGVLETGNSPTALDRMAIPWRLWTSMATTNTGNTSC
jgi:hypothetical protein